MPELLLKSGWMWLQGAVVSWMIFNPVGRVRQGVNLQVDLYADHPAALVLIWKMQDECSLLYKESIWKRKKKMLWVPRAFVKHCWMGASASRGDSGCHCRNWKKLYPGCFTLKVEVPTCGVMVMDVQTKGSRLTHFFFTFEVIGLAHGACHSVMTQENPLSEIPFSHFILHRLF